MSTQRQIRQELHIDLIPENRLTELRPLLAEFAEDYWNPVIEPASPEEISIIKKL
jgi:hypothetical protein